MGFNHLHCHTNAGSFMDSIVRIPELIRKVKESNMTHCAITDHGSMCGVVEFYDECVKNDIVPIIGCEMYICGGNILDKDKSNSVFHITLLAKNKIGYKNLVKLSSISNLEGKYMNRGRIDDVILAKYSEGLIGMSACISGKIPKAIINGSISLAEEYALVYKDIFGGDFFFEIMDNGIKEQYVVNDALISLSKKIGVGVVITNDIHYLNKDDKNAHDILKRIHLNKKEECGFDGYGYYFRNVDEFDDKYEQYVNTDAITNKIEKYDIRSNNDGEFFMPKVENASIKLREMCKLQLSRFDGRCERIKEYEDRLDHELKIIIDLGFPDYFLIVKDVVDWCRLNNILVGPGRGSVGGSLVAYLLNIIAFDPLNKECPLYFERFLNPHRVSPPDIDVDITDRDKVVLYLKDKYGDMSVNIGTISTLGTRDVINNIARVLSVSHDNVNKILDILPTVINDVTNKSLYDNNEEYRNVINNNKVLSTIYEYAVKLEGLCKNVSVHASGIIISPKNIDDVPMNIYKGIVFTQYNMHNIESMGYIKFDFLGLKTLKVIENTVKKINLNNKNIFKIDDIDYWNVDNKTMSLINNCMTTRVFQWESDGYKNLIKRVHPDTFNELIDLNTLYRPGPMESGLTNQYIDRKFGKEEVTDLHPSLHGKLKRQGLPLFQEEIMMVCNDVAGFTMSEADIMRKAIGKKDKDLLLKQKQKFIFGCEGVGRLSNVESVDLWNKIEKFARYSWNLSHGLAYTILSYWTAYLSAHYPLEFFASHMDVYNNFDKLLIIINEVRNRGIKIEAPDINTSDIDHVVKDGKIYMSLGSIKGIGEVAQNAILDERKNGSFIDFNDFNDRVSKKNCNSVVKESLIYSGAFDGTIYREIYKRKDLLMAVVNKKNEGKVKYTENLTPFMLMKEEFNRIGLYITCNPIEYFNLYIYESHSIAVEIVNVHKHVDKNGNQMCFLNATDYKRSYDFVVFSDVYQLFYKFFKVGSILVISYDIGNSRGYVLKSVLPIVYKNGLVDNAFAFLVPVVDYNVDNSNNFAFTRFVVYREDNGLILLSYKHGDVVYNRDVDKNKIVGYKIMSLLGG